MVSLLFSIIIPTLNEENYLPNLLKDLQKQADNNFEIIIVDGESTDKTKEIAQEFAKKLPLEFLPVKKKNVAFQRNFGAKKAKGKYLIFLDADARVGKNFLDKVKANILEKKGFLFLPTLISEDRSPKNRLIFKLTNSIIEASQTLGGKPLSAGGALIIEKNLFQSLGGYNEKLFIGEDHNFIQKAHDYGIKSKILKDVKVVFSMRRARKEGELQFLYKYFLASTHIFLNGDITEKIFNYEMGGQGYAKEKQKKEINRMRKLLNKVISFINE